MRTAALELAADAATLWSPALGAEGEKGSEIAETTIEMRRWKKDRQVLRLIAHRQRTTAVSAPAVEVEAHHRLRGGIPEGTIRQPKEDFGLIDTPVQNFFGNWLWWHACALADNVARWIRDGLLPRAFRRCRGKRLRLAFFNIAARFVRHACQFWLRIPRSHPWADAFIEPSPASAHHRHSPEPASHSRSIRPDNPTRTRPPLQRARP